MPYLLGEICRLNIPVERRPVAFDTHRQPSSRPHQRSIRQLKATTVMQPI